MNEKIRILNDIVPSFVDYPDNESLALCVVMMGCVHNCKGCQNPLFQNPNCEEGTRVVDIESLVNELKILCKRNRTNKVVLSGGDPLSPHNVSFTKELLTKLSNECDICIYTGHNIDYVKEHNVRGFKFVKCGKFELDKLRPSSKDDSKIIFASPNQMLYNSNYELISKDGVYCFN